MPLTSAEKQARYRSRNVVLLTADAHAIADKLMEMEDQAKLFQIVTLLKDRIDPQGSLARLAARTPLAIASPARSPSRPGSPTAKSTTHSRWPRSGTHTRAATATVGASGLGDEAAFALLIQIMAVAMERMAPT
jgi:hypothetical protein